MNSMNIQPGHIARHTPKGAGAQGREAAVIDVAQDLLLAHMHDMGVLDGLAIKGGTAILKWTPMQRRKVASSEAPSSIKH